MEAEQLMERLTGLIAQNEYPEYMTVEQAARYTTFAEGTIRNMVNKETIPFIKRLDRTIFKREELAKWMDEGLHIPKKKRTLIRQTDDKIRI